MFGFDGTCDLISSCSCGIGFGNSVVSDIGSSLTYGQLLLILLNKFHINSKYELVWNSLLKYISFY
jgi:hypothetical protein